MRAVMGVDAAWTLNEPSGIAVLVEAVGHWRCVGLAPSYQSFLEAGGGSVDRAQRRFRGSSPEAEVLLKTAADVAGRPIDVVAVDMPLSKEPIRGRRVADNAVSRAFGKFGCGTHSPSSERPGPISDRTRQEFEALGYGLIVADSGCGALPGLIEVYPHPALVRMLGANRRLECKVSKVRKYWPEQTRQERIERLLAVWKRVLDALCAEIDCIELRLPSPSDVRTLSSLKRYEDCIDALVCAWVATRFVEGGTEAYGDESAAIWIPSAVAAVSPAAGLIAVSR